MKILQRVTRTSARFSKSNLTVAKRALGKGKSSLRTALTRADRAFLDIRKACVRLAPRRGQTGAPETDTAQTTLLPSLQGPVPELPEPLYAQDGTVFLR